MKIDEGRCEGCGLCVSACREGAIGLVDGKAKLLRYDYCGGLGNCLPVGPSLPAFISPNILDVLVENFSLTPISTPEADLKKILG